LRCLSRQQRCRIRTPFQRHDFRAEVDSNMQEWKNLHTFVRPQQQLSHLRCLPVSILFAKPCSSPSSFHSNLSAQSSMTHHYQQLEIVNQFRLPQVYICTHLQLEYVSFSQLKPTSGEDLLYDAVSHHLHVVLVYSAEAIYCGVLVRACCLDHSASIFKTRTSDDDPYMHGRQLVGMASPRACAFRKVLRGTIVVLKSGVVDRMRA